MCVCVCVYVCVYVCMYVRMHVWYMFHTYIHTYIRIYVYTYVCIDIEEGDALAHTSVFLVHKRLKVSFMSRRRIQAKSRRPIRPGV